MNSSILESLREIWQLFEKLKQKDQSSYEERSEILKAIAIRMRPHVHQVATSIFLKVPGSTGSSGFHSEKGLRLSDRFEIGRVERKSELRDNELWLLPSGRFLVVKTKDYEFSRYVYDDEPIAHVNYSWEGEATEVAEPPEPLPPAKEVGEALARATLSFSETDPCLLRGVSEIGEDQGDCLLYVLKFVVEYNILCALSEFFLNLSPRSISILGQKGVRFLVSEPNFGRRRGSLGALARFGKSATNPLIDELSKSSSIPKDKRVGIVAVLGKIGDPGAVEPLIRILKEEHSPEVRRQAIVALGEIGDERAFLPIVKVWREFYDWRGVNEALERIRMRLTENSLESLIQLLSSESDAERKFGVKGLSKIRNEKAIEAITHVCKKDPNIGVRKVAVDMLAEVGSNKAVDALVQTYKGDREMREYIGFALDKLGKRPRSWREKLLGK